MYTAEGLANNNTVKGESFLKVCVIAAYVETKGKKGSMKNVRARFFHAVFTAIFFGGTITLRGLL